MQIGMVGLGKMGESMARRILQGGHDIVGFDLRRESVDSFVAAGGRGAEIGGHVARPGAPSQGSTAR